MISLNLTSPHQKNEIKLNRFYHLLRNNLSLITIILILTAIILLIARNTLQNNFSSVVAETSLIQQQIRGSNQKIRTINEQLNDLTKIQAGFIPWSNISVYLAKNTPLDIKINFLIISPMVITQQEAEAAKKNENKNKSWNITIKGIAKTRDDFFAFQDKLQKSSLLEEVKTPIDNITQKENIEFEFKAILSDKKLINQAE